MFARALELEAVEADEQGGVVLWFNDGGVRRPCRLPADGIARTLAAFALAQTRANGVFASPVEDIMLRAPEDAGEPPTLGVWPSGFPMMALALTWDQVTALSKAAEGALAVARRPSRRRH